ncbi:hypothetical protein RB594_003898 [Gaeumannomyces avenae]
MLAMITVYTLAGTPQSREPSATLSGSSTRTPGPGVGTSWLHALPAAPWHDRVLEVASRPGAVVLDLGCGIGGEVQQLAADVWTLGNRLFGTADGPAVRFLRADIYDEGDEKPTELEPLRGRIDVLIVCGVTDFFDHPSNGFCLWPMVQRLTKPGSLVVGWSLRMSASQSMELHGRFYHDTAVFREMIRVDYCAGRYSRDVNNEVPIQELGWDQSDLDYLPPVDATFPYPATPHPPPNVTGHEFVPTKLGDR